ncbi:CAP domain-containing protein [Pseudarthrobacter sp. N5]|uniref:CAP domain-containing protein n=1 Tax=Pseudarthrobacter sp. N5 TaxID=3418416 RepID=UPI003CE68838
MGKFAAPAVVAMICALALASPAASHFPVAPLVSTGPSASSPLPAETSRVALGPARAVNDSGGTTTAAQKPGEALAPAVDPLIRQAAPAAGTSTPALAPPEPASIPPLAASDADLAAAATAPAPAKEPAPQQSTTTESRALTPEALVPDSNSSQVNAVFNAVNSYRASLGLAVVKYHATVAGMAQEWSNSIASREVIEHRANFWTDPRALNPNNGAGEVIAVRWDRDAAQLVEWWKGSAAHNAILTDPRLNVIGIGITFTDGNWQTTPNRYTMWGVVDFFGYTTLPSGTTTSPGGSTELPPPAASLCDPVTKHMPPTVNLSAAAIKSAGDLVSVDSSGLVTNRPSLGNRSFGPPQTIGSGFGLAKELFITDWERDGVFDLLTQWADGRLTLHPGLAGGGFGTMLTLGQSGWDSMTLAVGGWCANNRMPQIIAKDTSGNLWLYPNLGTGDLTQRALSASGVAATRLSMVDFDADGFQDLLARQSDGNVLLYRGAGTMAPRTETRKVVANGWSDVTAIRPLRDVTGLNSTGVALRRANDTVQYWDLGSGALASPSDITGSWSNQRLAQ